MKISVQKQILQNAISDVQKAISGKVIMPILQGILIIAENSQITLIGSNIDLIIETKIQGNIIEEGRIVVDSRLFGDIIRKLPDGEIQLESKEDMRKRGVASPNVADALALKFARPSEGGVFLMEVAS